jgi:hypothetical protein
MSCSKKPRPPPRFGKRPRTSFPTGKVGRDASPKRRRAQDDIFEAIVAVSQKADGHCSLCGTEFPHKGITCGGITAADGSVADVGECCAGKLRSIHAVGFWYDPAAEDERIAADMLRRGGLTGIKSRLSRTETPWKNDDRAWFAANPQRSHRLRLAFPGELQEFEAPSDREIAVLVRQVAPGERIKLWCELCTTVPDDENFLHALFDVVSKGLRTPVNFEEVAVLARKYANGGGAS